MIVNVYAFCDRGDLNKARPFENRVQVYAFLTEKYSTQCGFGIDRLTQCGHYREAALDYDFTPFMGKYLVEREDGSCYSAWAPNKASLRTACGLGRKVQIFVYPRA